MSCESRLIFFSPLETGQASAIHDTYISLIFRTPSVSMFALLELTAVLQYWGQLEISFFHPIKNVSDIHCLQVFCLSVAPATVSDLAC